MQCLPDVQTNPRLDGGSAMPKNWVHLKRRGTRPPNSPGCRTPPPQKLRQKNSNSLTNRTHVLNRMTHPLKLKLNRTTHSLKHQTKKPERKTRERLTSLPLYLPFRPATCSKSPGKRSGATLPKKGPGRGAGATAGCKRWFIA